MTQPERKPDLRAAVGRRFLQLGFFVLIQAAILFGAAGRWDWPMAWAYVGLYVGLICVTALVIRNPELIAERGQIKANTKNWDKVLTVLYGVSGLGILLVAGLEQRFGWSVPPTPLVLVMSLVVFILGDAVTVWAMAANRFFASVVRIQADRGHQVVSGGPYQFVRHPGYVGFMLTALATPLMLASGWALLPALFLCGVIVIRTALEDRTLRQELAGYREYAARVRYRLLPGVW